ncbi:MAG: ATP-dependent DNA helicase RecG [Lachnospiraceae bacterium]|nr:ATP-dependent DNA helicase RecG [Lachnospiraceae bacterium]
MSRTDSVACLHGVGPKTEKLFQKLGVYTVEDMLLAFPRDYRKIPGITDIREISAEREYAVNVRIEGTPVVKNTSRMQVLLARVSDGTGVMGAVWYRMPYLKNQLMAQRECILIGRVVYKNGRYEMEQPEILDRQKYQEMAEGLQPIYNLTKGITNRQYSKYVKLALQEAGGTDYLPLDIRRRHNLMAQSDALTRIHFPENMDQLVDARRRLVFDEFFLFLLQMQRFKEHTGRIPNHFPLEPDGFCERLLQKLPFTLTDAQLRALGELERDLEGADTMQRLLQGDVGSGKTILAFLLMARMAASGRQSAIMAPTEVLAKQHYDTFCQWMKQFELDFPVLLLTGALTAKQKREVYERIAQEENALIVGTHALIQEKVSYRNLALVVTDEQHRFGVRQRETFSDKGMEQPHVLVMSATPIPRTLAIILYGDLDISVVDELPARRLPIKNCVVGGQKRETSWNFIRGEVEKGHQAYIICPLVEADEDGDTELEDVVSYTKKVKKYLPGCSAAFLHGKMNNSEKNQIMEDFAAGKIQILVSTTVIEVGINVPNATVMMIENAQRFGLAQLHQLRGRVGRGDAQSYCIMINTSNNEGAQKRLDILNHSNDGFEIASKDLKMRGPGDFFGIRQSGMLEFRLADVYQDAGLLMLASDEAKEYISRSMENPDDADEMLEAELSRRYNLYEKRINL